MSTSGIGRGVVIVDTFCDATTEDGRHCRYEGRTDVWIDTQDNTSLWRCNECGFEHHGRASDIWGDD